MKYYVIDRCVYAPCDGIDFETMATDTIDGDVWELYCTHPDAYKIENGKFVKIKPLEDLQNEELNSKYVPTVEKSITAFAKSYLKTKQLITTEEKMMVSGLYETWKPGNYSVGDIVNYCGQTWECHQAHDNSIYPDIKPSNDQTWYTFWTLLHGESKETARPFVKPTHGTVDVYKVGEYMIYTDGKIYECLRTTNYSPEEYPNDWKIIE